MMTIMLTETPNGIPSEGVTKLGVGTTNASVAPPEAPVGLPA